MNKRNLLLPVLAILTLLMLACSVSGDAESGSSATSVDPTATPDAIAEALAAVSKLNLGDVDLTGLEDLMKAFPDASGFADCLSSSIGLPGLLELAEREPTDADVELVSECLSEDQLNALISASELDLGDLEDFDLSGLTGDLFNATELNEIDITAMQDLMQELLNSPETMSCLSSSMSLSSLLELSSREPTEADMELILSCFSDDLLDSLPEGLDGLIVSP